MSKPKVILTRSEEDIRKDTEIFDRYGFKVIGLPLISTEALDFKLPAVKPDYVVFQSPKAVRYFLSRESIPQGSKLICVGKKTAESLKEFGLEADFLPEDSRAEGLIELFKSLRRGSVLIPRSAVGREELINFLSRSGFSVYVLNVYTTKGVVYEPEVFISKLREGNFILFASPSAVDSFFANLHKSRGKEFMRTLYVVAIGKTTKKALEEKGVRVDIVPETPSIEAVARLMREFWLENCQKIRDAEDDKG
jgi:uroporphyrinogen-III synthase